MEVPEKDKDHKRHLAFFGFVFHCNVASLSQHAKKKNRAFFKRNRTRASDLRMKFFLDRKSAQKHAQYELKARKAFDTHRLWLTRLAHSVQNLEKKILGQSFGRKIPEFKRLESRNFQVNAVPLSVAFRLVQQYPSYYEIHNDKVEQAQARKLIEHQKGHEAAKRLSGVPLFSIPGVKVILKGEGESVAYTPMFFSKNQLDKVWDITRNILSQTIVNQRKWERRNNLSKIMRQVVSVAGINMSNPTENDSDDRENDGDESAGIGDPPEIKEFLEELGESQMPSDRRVNPLKEITNIASSLACSTTALLGTAFCIASDAVDGTIFQHKWGWKLFGLNPNINVCVDTLQGVMREIEKSENGVSPLGSMAVIPYNAAKSEKDKSDESLSDNRSTLPEAEVEKEKTSAKGIILQNNLPFHISAVLTSIEKKKTEDIVNESGRGLSMDNISLIEEEEHSVEGRIEFDWNEVSEGSKEVKKNDSILSDRERGLLLIGSIGLSSTIIR